MTTLLERIADYNNLYWAWHKAKNIYRPGDIWYNELEVAHFEANLSDELQRIHNELLDDTYKLELIHPVAYPKSHDDKGPRTRQTFWVSVRDQVTWLAVVNVIGGYIDSQMPYWSYGNRLYLTVFYDDETEDRNDRKYGYYRNTTRNLFRKWTQSWPLYRRHINLTARLIAKPEKEVKENLEEEEKQVFDQNEELDVAHPMQAAYLLPGYWESTPEEKLYWAGIDLEKFYPNINQDAIKSNIRLGLEGKVVTDSLFMLIDRLLDFRINFEGWGKTDLKKIGLPRVEKYDHLPTGLFVAGFLANTALLDIDKQVKKKLETNRDIAHFRFVDDHVILATSFEKLMEWINAYKEILENAGVGAKINLEKTVPKPLAAYFKCINSEKRIKEKEYLTAAKKATELDPDFPNPLMTQTLAKVSKIARTDFNLLTPDEEKSLIADVEHLLVTDFPDHELRKDTRVSFAARMLSTMIPKMMIDSNVMYERHKAVCFQKKVIADYTTARTATKDLAKETELTEDISLAEQRLTEEIELLQKEKKRLKDQEDQLSNRTIKLLLKAVRENHDKVRLWARLLEFFQKSGSGKPIMVIRELERLVERKETNKLSITFIRALIMQILAALLLDTLKIIDNKQYSYRRRKRAEKFLQNILDIDLFIYLKKTAGNGAKPYEKLSLKMLQCSAGTVLHLMEKNHPSVSLNLPKNLIKRSAIISWKKPHQFFDRSGFDPGTWCWWLLDMLPSPLPGNQPILWPEISALTDPLKVTELNLLLRYPAHIPTTKLARFDEVRDARLRENEGVLFDIAQSLKTQLIPYEFLQTVIKKSWTMNERRSIFEWIVWTKQEQGKQVSEEHYSMKFDPRLGEWTALILIKQIAESIIEASISTVDSKRDNVAYYRRIHPNNFTLPLRWIENAAKPLTWEALRNLFNRHGKVEMRSVKDMIIDNRYLPPAGVDFDKENQVVLNALGSLLISLLAKDTTLPDKWNPLGQQLSWMGLARIKLRDIAVSTFTHDIIGGCFSSRNIETLLFKRINLSADFPYAIADDNKLDPPTFMDIHDFLRYVNSAINRLEKQQISVTMHQPRQLTPVSLIQLKHDNLQDLPGEQPLEKENNAL